MAAFRRCVIALAVLAIFAGLASAQAPTPMTCNLSSLNTTARAEGKAELVSDLLLTCTGGSVNLASTTAAPTVNFTLTLPTNITSRILSTAGGNSYSEALLLIDDPGTSATPLNGDVKLTGYGNNAAPAICVPPNPPAGCTAYPNVVDGVPLMSLSSAALGSPTTGAANVYQGIVSQRSVTFFGVPAIPPGSTSTRTFRITNVRTDASSGSTGPVVGNLQVQGGANSPITLNQTQATLATVQTSLTVKSNTVALSNCTPASYAFAGSVVFTENFASAFRVRQSPNNNTNSGQNGQVLTQTTPGSFFSESGYEINGFTGGIPTGLADFGTRLKAVFNNIPSGVRVFVSFANVTGTNTAVGTISNVYNTPNVGNTTTTTLAELISGGENVVDGTTAPVATPSITTATTGPGPVGFPYAELTVSGGTATAVWEVLNQNPAAIDIASFDVFVLFPAQQPTGQATVNASYAPLVSGTIPNFIDPNAASPQNAFSVTQCKTTLLFPYVTSAAGFDTGMAVANTTADVFGTVAQTGTCQFTLYGTPTPIPTLAASPSIAAGTTYAFALSQFAPGFTGYAIAVCNFQFAHGFAYVANWTSPTVSSAMGYLALVMPYVGTTAGSRAFGGNAETLMH